MLRRLLFWIKSKLGKIMPLKKCQKDGKSGWKWGDHGNCYGGKEGKKQAMKQGVAIELSKQKAGKPSEFDKASLPTQEMIEAANKGLALRQEHNKGGENLLILTLAQKISSGEFLYEKDVAILKKEFSKRKRFANAQENTLGYINYLMIGGPGIEKFLNERTNLDTNTSN